MPNEIRQNMMKIFSKTHIKSIAIFLLFVISSTGGPALNPAAAAVPQSNGGQNWISSDGNFFNQNFNPQTIINAGNVANLQLNWIFPLPPNPASLSSVGGNVGEDTTPIIYNGVVYILSQYGQLWAVDAANGNTVWTTLLPIRPNSTSGLDLYGTLSFHLHNGAMQLTTQVLGGTPTLWIAFNDMKIYAINALNGRFVLNFSYYTGRNSNGLQGNGPASAYKSGSPSLLIDEQRGILVTAPLATSQANAARGVVQGWNINVNPPTVIWTTYYSPPQVGSALGVDPNWTVNQVNGLAHAWIFKGYGNHSPGGYGDASGAIDLKSLSPSVLNATLYNDWGYVMSPACNQLYGGKNPGGIGAGWGDPWVLDSKTGMAYISTGNRGPYVGNCIPGPDLWSASLLAFDDTTGKMVWGFSAVPHDVWDYDCSWNQALGNETINGVNTEVVWKTCKAGYLFELNAATGALIWSFTAPQADMPRCPVCWQFDPLNRTQMTQGYPDGNVPGHSLLLYPSDHGAFENGFAYDVTNNNVVVAYHLDPAYYTMVAANATNYATANGFQRTTPVVDPKLDNTTVYAINGQTGQIAWKYFIPSLPYRGGITVSGGVVYLSETSGVLQLLNAKTGALIQSKLIGGALNVLPAIAATQSGVMQVYVTEGGGSSGTYGGGVPGNVIALSLGAATSASTITSSVTSTTTVSGGATATVTSTTTVAGGAGATTTVTSISTAAGGGIDPTVTYGIAAVAAIFIIATGFLAMRGRRKPAP